MQGFIYGGRWVDNFKMGLRELGWGGMDWIHLAQDRNRWRALMNNNEPTDSVKCWEVVE
jgi:hypothetical protein